eukprot:347178-Rhodomonas_salina.2
MCGTDNALCGTGYAMCGTGYAMCGTAMRCPVSSYAVLIERLCCDQVKAGHVGPSTKLTLQIVYCVDAANKVPRP